MNRLVQLLSRRLPGKFRDRADAKSIWVSRYRDSEWSQVEEFLRLFCDAFLLRRAEVPYLYPDDKPIEIYQEIFRFWPVDELQFAHLQKALDHKYGLKILVDDFEFQTLGDLYDRVRCTS